MAKRSIFIRPALRPQLFDKLALEPISPEEAIREALLRGFSNGSMIPHPDDPKGVKSSGFPKEFLENPQLVPGDWLVADNKKDGKEGSKDGKDDSGKEDKDGKEGKDGSDGKEASDPDDRGLLHSFVLYGRLDAVKSFLRPIM
jgi:hypothetical protein